MKNNKFNIRSFTAFVVTWSFLIATVTGIILFIVPQGRVANWVNWEFLSLLKGDWGNIHLVFGAIFIIGGILHLYYNWKPFKKYLADRIKGHVKPRKELLVSLAICSLLVVGAIKQTVPFNYFFELNEWAKASWVISSEYEPPFGHAEEMSLQGFSKRQNMDIQQVLAELKSNQIHVEDIRQEFGDIAKSYDLNAMQLYALIKHLETYEKADPEKLYTVEMVEDQFEGTGVGKKTFVDISKQLHLDVAEIKKILTDKGIRAQEDENFRTIASRYDIDPVDIIKLLLVKDYRLAESS